MRGRRALTTCLSVWRANKHVAFITKGSDSPLHDLSSQRPQAHLLFKLPGVPRLPAVLATPKTRYAFDIDAIETGGPSFWEEQSFS